MLPRLSFFDISIKKSQKAAVMYDEKFEKERQKIIEIARKGIYSNIPLAGVQKKYLKNLLLFALMNASVNKTVTNRNFVTLVNKLYKRLLVKIVTDNSDDDEDDVDEGLDIELNNIIANESLLNLEELQALLTPGNIVSAIKESSNGANKRQILDRLLALRDAKANHRETPEEAREREQRQKEYELQRQRERMMQGRAITRERDSR